MRQWLAARRGRIALALFVAGFGLLNVWTYRHAWALTHFSSGGESTLRPEQLSGWAKTGVLLAGVNLPRPTNDLTPADVGLEFSVHEITSADGTALEAWLVPHDQPRAVVCLFHGYGSSKSRLLNEARAFHEMGCSAVLVDFRGSGGSDGDMTTLGVYEAADVAAVCRFAREAITAAPLVLFGRSMGSVAILRAVAREDVRPSAIVVECPFDRLLGTVRRRFSAMHLPSFPCAELLVFWGGVQHGMNGFAHNPVEYAAAVHCPALVLQGDADRRVAVEEVQRITGALSGQKRLEIFPGVGHESCFRSRPDRWREHVGEFLAGIE